MRAALVEDDEDDDDIDEDEDNIENADAGDSVDGGATNRASTS